MLRTAAVCALAAFAFAEEEPTLEDLQRKNAELEERVRSLEKRDLERAVDRYLEEHEALRSAQGADTIHPGSQRLRITGEVRIRQEWKDHLYSPGDPDGLESFEFTHMRTRVRFEAGVVENVQAVVVLQDIRAWGEEESTTGDLEGVDLKVGEMIFRNVAGAPLEVEAGRWVMKYGDQRLVGDLEWFDQGRSYDGIRALWGPETYSIDVWAVRVRDFQPDSGDDQSFFGVYGGTKDFREWLDIELYVLILDDNLEGSTADSFFTTLGTRLFGRSGNWTYTGEFAWQTGDVADVDLDAWAFAVTGQYTWANVQWKPKIRFEIAYATGDDAHAGETEQFQTLFPTNHLWYGYADLVGWSNIIDFRVGGTLDLNPQVFITLDYHYFRRQNASGAWVNAGGAVIRPGVTGSSKDLGQEVDLQLIWRPSKPVSVLFGWAIFLPGDFVEETGADPTAQFGYIQGRVKF